MSSSSLYIVYLEDEYLHKKPLAEFFKECMFGQSDPPPLKIWYASDSGPRSCYKEFAEVLHCESTQTDSLNKRLRRALREGGSVETDEEYKNRMRLIRSSPDNCGVVMLMSRELRKDINEYDSTSIFQEWKWNEEKTQVAVETEIDESVWKEKEPKTKRSLPRDQSAAQQSAGSSSSFPQSSNAVPRRQEESKQPPAPFQQTTKLYVLPPASAVKQSAPNPESASAAPGPPKQGQTPLPNPQTSPAQVSTTPVPSVQTQFSPAKPGFSPQPSNTIPKPPTLIPSSQPIPPPTQSPNSTTPNPPIQPLFKASLPAQTPAIPQQSPALGPSIMQPPTFLPSPNPAQPLSLQTTSSSEFPTQTSTTPTKPPNFAPPSQPQTPFIQSPNSTIQKPPSQKPPIIFGLPAQTATNPHQFPTFGPPQTTHPAQRPDHKFDYQPPATPSSFQSVPFKPGNAVQPPVELLQASKPTQPSPPLAPQTFPNRQPEPQKPPFQFAPAFSSANSTPAIPRPPMEEEKRMASSLDLSSPRGRYIQQTTTSLTSEIEAIFSRREVGSSQAELAAVREVVQRFQEQCADRISCLQSEVLSMVNVVSGITDSVEAVKNQQEKVLAAMGEVVALVERRQENDAVAVNRQLLEKLNEKYAFLYETMPPQAEKKEAVFPVKVYRQQSYTEVTLENRKRYDISSVRIDMQNSGFASLLLDVPVLPPGQTSHRINYPLLGPGYIRLSQNGKKLFDGYISFDSQGNVQLSPQGPPPEAGEQEVQQRISAKALRVWNLLSGQQTSDLAEKLRALMQEPTFDILGDEEIVNRLRQRS